VPIYLIHMEKALPAIPAKRYFTIGEVSELCGVKPYVLRYWEQEFTQLKPMKRRGNRRYYQHHEVLLIRRIRELLYEQGFTISGARNRMAESVGGRRHDDAARGPAEMETPDVRVDADDDVLENEGPTRARAAARAASSGNGIGNDNDLGSAVTVDLPELGVREMSTDSIRQELQLIRKLLGH
jgi:DNA-binding transcriptional MerR regulator